MKKKIIVLAALGVVMIGGVLLVTLPGRRGETKTVIAVANLMSHPILDAVEDSMMQELAKNGYVEGERTHFIRRNANGQMQAVPTIVNELAAQKPDIIIAITTPVSQAAVKVAKCPVVFGAVTDPVGAGLVKALDQGEPMVTGTSDAVPYDEQLRLIKRITPSVKRLGVLFNPGEAASQYGIKQLRRFAPEMGFTLVEGAVSSTSEVYPVAQSLVGRVDAILISTDNTVAAGIAAAVKVASENDIPLYACDSGSVEKGALAAVSAGYPQVGRDTADLAVRVLQGERNLRTITAKGSELYINRKAAELMGVELPSELVESATKVYDEIKE